MGNFETKENLGSNIEFIHNDHLGDDLKALQNVRFDPRWTSLYMIGLLSGAEIEEKDDPIEILKACKDKGEISGMKRCHLADGVALISFFTGCIMKIVA